jgi:hypothetical protein
LDGVSSLEYIAISWTETQSYSGVSISAELANSGTGEAYLMTAIGPGTTTSSQLASVPVTFPGAATSTVLFSGLSLGPGTYYLLLSGNTLNQLAGWEVTYSNSPTITTDSGVTRTPGDYFTDALPVAYPPSATFTFTPYESSDGYLLYSVTGTPVTTPEPSTGTLLSVALGLMCFRWVRRKPPVV